MRKLLIIILLITFSFNSKSQNIEYINTVYISAFNELNNMLIHDSLYNFKKAVYVTENAYYENNLDKEEFDYQIEKLVYMANQIIQNSKLLYNYDDIHIIEKYGAVFKLMTDTLPIIVDTNKLVYHVPYSYDFDDFNGRSDWSKMFVTKLLNSHTGNCHSLPFLYKIIGEEMGVPVHLSLAPNHIYIKQHSKGGGWYNTELTNATFPIDAWLMASGYIHLDAIRSGIYMDTLSNRNSLAVCLVDLAKGYERKIGVLDGEFILRCCDTALAYFPNYINALLLKAETQKKIFEYEMKKIGFQYASEMFLKEKWKNLFEDMENTYAIIHTLGYRRMPEEMYVKWLVSLKNEKEKYLNKKIINTFTQPK